MNKIKTVVSLIMIFFILFLINYMSDVLLDLQNASLTKNISVAFGVTVGIGCIWVSSKKKGYK